MLGTGGLVERDWTAEPVYDPVTELYSPVDDVREPNSVQPIYLWHNGQVAEPDQPWPGSRSDLTSRIQPFKLFTATVPSDVDSGQPIPLKLGVFYTAGRPGAGHQRSALTSRAWTTAATGSPRRSTLPLQISHGVVGKQDARQCQDCHVPDGIMDFASMGYTPQEVAVLTSISAESAGQRQPLQMSVVIPAAQPLPTPVNLSGNLEATRGFGVRIPWNPFLVLLVSIGIVGGGAYWLRRQKPAASRRRLRWRPSQRRPLAGGARIRREQRQQVLVTSKLRRRRSTDPPGAMNDRAAPVEFTQLGPHLCRGWRVLLCRPSHGTLTPLTPCPHRHSPHLP